MSWTTRVKSRMKELEMTQEMLAHKMGITRGAVTHYLAGRRVPPLKQFQKLAAILKADPAWLQFGTKNENNTSKLITKREKAVPVHNRIPILSWEQISTFMGSKIISEEVTDYLPNYYTDQPHWYAMRVRGDAMTVSLSGNKSFHDGDIIIIDPEKTVVHGSYVIALLPKAKEATFKQYVIDSGICYLKPLNPQYPIIQIDESTHICGVVVGYLSVTF